MNRPDPPDRPMNSEETLFALFIRLRKIWLSEYGSCYTIRGKAIDIVFRVRGRKPATPDTPTFVLTVRPIGYGFEIRHQPSGMNATAPEVSLVEYEERRVLDRLFGEVMRVIEAERGRLMQYRQDGKS